MDRSSGSSIRPIMATSSSFDVVVYIFCLANGKNNVKSINGSHKFFSSYDLLPNWALHIHSHLYNKLLLPRVRVTLGLLVYRILLGDLFTRGLLVYRILLGDLFTLGLLVYRILLGDLCTLILSAYIHFRLGCPKKFN